MYVYTIYDEKIEKKKALHISESFITMISIT